MANLRVENLTGTGGRNAIDGSVFFDGSGDHLLVSTSTDFDYGSNDFTIEFWWRRNTTERVALFHGSWGSDWSIGIDYNGAANNQKLGFWASSNGTSWDMLIADAGGNGISTGTPDLDSWSHIAYVRYGNIFRGYLNGIEIVEVSSSSSIHSKTTTSQPAIGAWFNSETAMSDLHGYLSNFRIVKGSALYTANFTPPTEKLTAIDGTVLLCCQDSNNALQEATGKTITGFGNLAAFSSGDNLITNGTFDSSTTGWTSDGTITIDSNRLKVTNDAANYRSAYQDVTVVVGKAYRVSADCIAGTSNNSNFHVGTTSSSNALASAVTSPVVVRPTETTLRVTLNVGSNTPGHTALYDNVEAREVEPPKAPKVLPPYGIDEGVVFEGDMKMNSQGVMYFPTGDTSQRGRGRGLLGGSNDGSPFSDSIQYINIQSQGNSVDFGNLTVARSRASSYASSTRGIWGGGASAPTSKSDTIDYVTIATTANAIDFGNLTVSRRFCSGTSSATRGLTAGGNEAPPSSPYPSVNVIDYTTIASAGDALDFGDLLGKRSGLAALSSPTRALFAGGYGNGSPAGGTNDITYVEIATTGNSVDFGDLTNSRRYLAGVSNNTRGVFGSGSVPGANNTIDYVTIATLGDALDFGDATIANEHRAAISNSIRGVYAGSGSPAIGNTIDFITIASTGNADDFGDTATNMGYSAGCSDSHGGLS